MQELYFKTPSHKIGFVVVVDVDVDVFVYSYIST